MSGFDFDNTYVNLPDEFFARQSPDGVARPGAIRTNTALAHYLGIDADWLAGEEGVATIAGNHVPPGAAPLAAVYAGHQFGSFNPQLGDGRALLLGEVIAKDGQRYDIQLKGSGRTPYSRGGDGRSPLGPVLREYVVSEAMYRLGVPTTRALAAVTTGETVARESLEPGAVLARVASSHIRIGTFEFFAARGNTDAVQTLCDYVIERHFPAARDSENAVLAMLQGVIARQADLIARWQLLGFIHGVMNTDNMLLCGETVDYGPCAFMDQFNPAQKFSSIDTGGRYAYSNQPGIAHWNLSRLAQALLPLLHSDKEEAVQLAQSAIDAFPELFFAAHRDGLAAKLGIAALQEDDMPLVEELFDIMAGQRMDFTLTFRQLADSADADGGDAQSILQDFPLPDELGAWLPRWRERCARDDVSSAERVERMRAANPAFIPRNHQVQAAIEDAYRDEDFGRFNALVDLLQEPFVYRPEKHTFAAPPQPEEVVARTFCGT